MSVAGLRRAVRVNCQVAAGRQNKIYYYIRSNEVAHRIIPHTLSQQQQQQQQLLYHRRLLTL